MVSVLRYKPTLQLLVCSTYHSKDGKQVTSWSLQSPVVAIDAFFETMLSYYFKKKRGIIFSSKLIWLQAEKLQGNYEYNNHCNDKRKSNENVVKTQLFALKYL